MIRGILSVCAVLIFIVLNFMVLILTVLVFMALGLLGGGI